MTTVASKWLIEPVTYLAEQVSASCRQALAAAREWSRSGPSNVESAERFESLVSSIRELLGLPEISAASYARQVMRNEVLLRESETGRRTALPKSTDYSPQVLSLSKQISEAINSPARACLLALPASCTSIMLIRHLSDCRRDIRIVVLNTPLSSSYLAHLRPAGPVKLVESTEMIRLIRTAVTKPAEPTIYITFPDHEVTGSGTMWPVAFCRDEYLFSILEPMILSCLSMPLLTLDTSDSSVSSTSSACLSLVECPIAVRGSSNFHKQASDLLAWIAARMERVIQACPGEILSWNHILLRSTRLEWWHLWCQLKAFEAVVREAYRIDSGSNVLPAYEASRRTLAGLQALLIHESPKRAMVGEATA